MIAIRGPLPEPTWQERALAAEAELDEADSKVRLLNVEKKEYKLRVTELENERDRLTLALKDARRSLALEMYAGSRSKTAKIIEDALADDTA